MPVYIYLGRKPCQSWRINFGWISTRMAVLRTKKELPVLEQRSRGHVRLISRPYDDSSAPYLGTAILTIFCFLYLLNNEQIHD